MCVHVLGSDNVNVRLFVAPVEAGSVMSLKSDGGVELDKKWLPDLFISVLISA